MKHKHEPTAFEICKVVSVGSQDLKGLRIQCTTLPNRKGGECRL